MQPYTFCGNYTLDGPAGNPLRCPVGFSCAVRSLRLSCLCHFMDPLVTRRCVRLTVLSVLPAFILCPVNPNHIASFSFLFSVFLTFCLRV